MKQNLKLTFIIILTAIVFFYIGTIYKPGSTSNPEQDFEKAANNYPQGLSGVPAQWFMMKSLVGWERMMFIFGYSDDKQVCDHLVDVASKESPDRQFRCEDAK